MGVLIDDIMVNPTISEKNKVADSKTSGTTSCPAFNISAQLLEWSKFFAFNEKMPILSHIIIYST